MGDIEDYPFSFMNSPSRLQVLASTELALCLWRYKFKYAASSYSYASVCSLLEQSFSCEEMGLAVVPPGIKTTIDQRIATVCFELRDWIYRYMYPTVYTDDFPQVFSMCLKLTVVNYAGSIGGKTTAVNITQSDEFRNLEKSNTIIGDVFERLKCQAREILSVVVDDVPDRERISRVPSFVQRGYEQATIYLDLLPKLNRVQAEKVFEENAPKIIRTLASNNTYFVNVREFWADMKHVVLKNESCFCDVIDELWRSIFDFVNFDEPYPYLSNLHCDQTNDFLLEIWSNAPDELKTAVSNQCISSFFTQLPSRVLLFLGPHHCCYGRDMTVPLDMLKRSQNLNKEQAWRTYWRLLVECAKPTCLEKFMKLCLPNEAVELFKNELLKLNHRFSELIWNGLYSHLKYYLKFCTKDVKHLQSTSVALLSNNIHVIWKHNEDSFAKFNRFLVDLSSMVNIDVDELKAQAITSRTENLKFLRDMVFQRDSKEYLRRMNHLITSAPLLQLMKRKFVDLCRDLPINGHCELFSADKWQWFLEWCTGEREEIAALKRSLDIDAIFLKRLRDYADGKRFGNLTFLDEFLRWYFGNEKDAKNFKLEKVKNYKQIEVLSDRMESKSTHYEDGIVYKLLMWFFHRNVKNVREFCKTCGLIIRRRREKPKGVFIRKRAHF